jgi:hypothetical protein
VVLPDHAEATVYLTLSHSDGSNPTTAHSSNSTALLASRDNTMRGKDLDNNHDNNAPAG